MFRRERVAYERENFERKPQAGTSQGTPASLVFPIEPTIMEILVDLPQFGEDMQKRRMSKTTASAPGWTPSRRSRKMPFP
jgi:hypothetical protein